MRVFCVSCLLSPVHRSAPPSCFLLVRPQKFNLAHPLTSPSGNYIVQRDSAKHPASIAPHDTFSLVVLLLFFFQSVRRFVFLQTLPSPSFSFPSADQPPFLLTNPSFSTSPPLSNVALPPPPSLRSTTQIQLTRPLCHHLFWYKLGSTTSKATDCSICIRQV